jgi:hypothetical protein
VDWVTLAEAVQALRDELTMAQESGETQDVQFDVGPVEIEMAVVAKRSASAKVGFTFLVPLGADGGIAREETHRIKVTLTPSNRATGTSLKIRDRTSAPSDG